MSRENDAFIAGICEDWVKWTKTRRFYVNSYAGGSLLGKLAAPSSSGKEANGRNYPDMQYFNMAVHTCSDMEKYKTEWEAFKEFYLVEKDKRTVAKRAAADLGVCRRTYYNHVKKFARAAYAMSLSLKKAHEAMSSMAARPAPAAAAR